MKKSRPVFLNLTQIRFPCTAIASILHRISGVIMFLAIPLLICLLGQTLQAPPGFAKVQAWLQLWWVKVIVWGLLAALTYHALAGIRHLLADFEWGESLWAARLSAYILFLITAVMIILEAYWLW